MVEPHDVAAAFAAARAELERDASRWITRASLTERAYFLGLYHGLAALAPGDTLGAVAFRHLRDCTTPRDGDDAFRDSQFASALELLREAIADPRQPELDTLHAALGALVAHAGEVERERERAMAAIREAVEAIEPFTLADAFRTLDHGEHERLQHLVQSLEGPLRRLASVDLHWASRLGLEDRDAAG